MNYTYLVICEEGYVYNSAIDKCEIFDSKECAIPRTSEDKCLVCGSFHPYLKDNGVQIIIQMIIFNNIVNVIILVIHVLEKDTIIVFHVLEFIIILNLFMYV